MRISRTSCYLAVFVLGWVALMPVQAALNVPVTAFVPDLPVGGAEAIQTSALATVVPEEGCEVIAESTELGGSSFAKWAMFDFFHVEYLSRLDEVKFGLICQEGTISELRFSVHERCPADSKWGRIADDLILHDAQCNEAGDYEPRYYESGSFNSLPLLPECEYAIGVSWDEGQAVMAVYDRDVTYPQDFSSGWVMGSFGMLTMGYPVPDEFAMEPYTGSAYLMQICLDPEPGACCLSGGACEDRTEKACLNAGGVFSAQRVTCDELESQGLGCPMTDGACCVDDGEGGSDCVVTDKFSCDENEGTWHGGEDCTYPDPCIPRGACCLDYGVCLETTEDECVETYGGVYQGDDVLCDAIGPKCSFGACCVNDACVELSEVACYNSGGLWRGHGSDCDTDICAGIPPGACCLSDSVGVCVDGDEGMTEDGCAELGGTYQGDWSTCDTLAVSCGRGACCMPGEGCKEGANGLTENQCSRLGGTYQGNGTTCETLDPQCPGACCWEGMCLDDWSPRDCEDLGGAVFAGYELACPAEAGDPDPCAAALQGSCCLPGGSCVTVESSIVCTALRGTWDDTKTCGPEVCEPTIRFGTCCLPDGRCAEVEASICTDESGDFTEGAECSPDTCAVCCRDGGTCDENVAFCDPQAGGHYHADRNCTAGVGCPSVGACCLTDESCEELTEGACLNQDGLYHGDGTACPEAPDPPRDCSRAACCLPDGSCADTTEELCTAAGGDYTSGQDCDGHTCPEGRACCFEGRCEILTEDKCDDVAGVYQRDVLECDADACTVGACCFEDRECENLTRDACADEDGTHAGVGTDCGLGTPCSIGACCLPDGRCAEMSEGACAAVDGTYQGAAVVCDSDMCTLGACCLTTGGCDVLTLNECAGEGGVHRGIGTLCEEGSDICTRGACCHDDRECEDSLFSDECGDGEFHPDTACADAGCTPIGACCLVGGTCIIRTEALCQGLGGTYRGDEVECEEDTCVTGACCKHDGRCFAGGFASECPAELGVFEAGVNCIVADCPAASACCDDFDECSTLTADACAASGGTSFGADVYCDDGSCPGACCLPGGGCVLASMEACEDEFGGEYHGDADCSSYTCGGACCLSDGVCLYLADWECVEDDAVFSVGQDCEAITCDPRGACCNSGTCSGNVSQAQCEAGGGIYLGDLSDCTGGPCDLGGCCHEDGACEDGLIAMQCAGPEDDFNTAGCGLFTCDAPAAACCHSNTGNCNVLSRTACDSKGGLYHFGIAECGSTCLVTGEACVCGVPAACRKYCSLDSDLTCSTDLDCANADAGTCEAQSCISPMCVEGACCTVDGVCFDEVVESECPGVNDEFTMGYDCDSIGDCEPRRACCTGYVCEVLTQADCIAGGGSWSTTVTDCPADFCETGACCRADGTCTVGTGLQCAHNAGVFQGAATACDTWDGWCHACCAIGEECFETGVTSLCDDVDGQLVDGLCADNLCPGACCKLDGSCEDLTQAECASLSGWFSADLKCGEFACPVYGACCAGGLCEMSTANECAAIGGVHFAGEICDAGLDCSLGSCCDYSDGACAELQVASLCAGQPEVFYVGLACGVSACNNPEYPTIRSSDPVSGSVDARQPHPVDDATSPAGWDTVLLRFESRYAADVGDLTPSDFVVTQTGGIQPAPTVLTVDQTGLPADVVRLTLSRSIEPDSWTKITHEDSDTSVCLGYLPADVNQSLLSDADDIGAMIACLNAPGSCQQWQADANRSGAVDAQDILRTIDLLNGGGEFTSWSGETLDASPCD